MALAAALAQVISGATSLALGGWTSSVDLSRSRYSRVPAFALARAALVTVATLGCAILGLSAAVTLLSVSGLGVAFECLRFALAMHSEPSLRDVNPSPVRGILHEARGSLVFYLATATQNGLQPYVAAAVSSKVLSVAVPARTLSNSARSLSTAVVNVIWVPVAARLAELRDSAERLRFWRRNSPTLWTVHLAGIVGLLGLAPLVVPRWLPAKSHDILAILPFYCAEQGAYIAAIPSIVLLQATGRFGALGAVTLATAIATVAGTLLLTPAYGAAGFAGASAASAVLILAPALVTLEWLYWRETGVSATSSLAPRVGLALLVGACALPYAQHRWTTVLGLTVVLVIVTWHTLRARAKTVPVGA
jgi:O-antigen/teichoic acid export membrane protein